MEKSTKVKFAYFPDRCLGIMVQYIAEICKLDYDYKQYEVRGPPDYIKEEWYSEKYTLGLDFPNLPYLIDGEFKMTETIPIMKYLCEKHRPELLGCSIEERAKVNMVSSVIESGYNETIYIAYYKKDAQREYLETCYSKLEPISKFMGENKFLVGDQVTFIDIFLHEWINTLKAFEKGNGDLESKFPNLSRFQSHVKDLPEIKDFISSDRFRKQAYFNSYYGTNVSDFEDLS